MGIIMDYMLSPVRHVNIHIFRAKSLCMFTSLTGENRASVSAIQPSPVSQLNIYTMMYIKVCMFTCLRARLLTNLRKNKYIHV